MDKDRRERQPRVQVGLKMFFFFVFHAPRRRILRVGKCGRVGEPGERRVGRQVSTRRSGRFRFGFQERFQVQTAG